MFLYKYGKYVLLSKQMRYYGSGMGILDEAYWQSVSTWLGKIKFFMGRYFEEYGVIEKAR